MRPMVLCGLRPRAVPLGRVSHADGFEQSGISGKKKKVYAQPAETPDGREVMLYKRNKTWWYSFTWDGRRYQESTGLENRKAAEEVEAGRRVQLSKGEVGLIDKPKYSIHELL